MPPTSAPRIQAAAQAIRALREGTQNPSELTSFTPSSDPDGVVVQELPGGAKLLLKNDVISVRLHEGEAAVTLPDGIDVVPRTPDPNRPWVRHLGVTSLGELVAPMQPTTPDATFTYGVFRRRGDQWEKIAEYAVPEMASHDLLPDGRILLRPDPHHVLTSPTSRMRHRAWPERHRVQVLSYDNATWEISKLPGSAEADIHRFHALPHGGIAYASEGQHARRRPWVDGMISSIPQVIMWTEQHDDEPWKRKTYTTLPLSTGKQVQVTPDGSMLLPVRAGGVSYLHARRHVDGVPIKYKLSDTPFYREQVGDVGVHIWQQAWGLDSKHILVQHPTAMREAAGTYWIYSCAQTRQWRQLASPYIAHDPEGRLATPPNASTLLLKDALGHSPQGITLEHTTQPSEALREKAAIDQFIALAQAHHKDGNLRQHLMDAYRTTNDGSTHHLFWWRADNKQRMRMDLRFLMRGLIPGLPLPEPLSKSQAVLCIDALTILARGGNIHAICELMITRNNDLGIVCQRHILTVMRSHENLDALTDIQTKEAFAHYKSIVDFRFYGKEIQEDHDRHALRQLTVALTHLVSVHRDPAIIVLYLKPLVDMIAQDFPGNQFLETRNALWGVLREVMENCVRAMDGDDPMRSTHDINVLAIWYSAIHTLSAGLEGQNRHGFMTALENIHIDGSIQPIHIKNAFLNRADRLIQSLSGLPVSEKINRQLAFMRWCDAYLNTTEHTEIRSELLRRLSHVDPYVRTSLSNDEAMIEVQVYISNIATMRLYANTHGVDTRILESCIEDAMKTCFALKVIMTSSDKNPLECFMGMYSFCQQMQSTLNAYFQDKMTWVQDQMIALLNGYIQRHEIDINSNAHPLWPCQWMYTIRQVDHATVPSNRGLQQAINRELEEVYLRLMTSMGQKQRSAHVTIRASFAGVCEFSEHCDVALKSLLKDLPEQTHAWVDSGASLHDIIHAMSELQYLLTQGRRLNSMSRVAQCKDALKILRKSIPSVMEREDINYFSFIETWTAIWDTTSKSVANLLPNDEQNFFDSSYEILEAIFKKIPPRMLHESLDQDVMDMMVRRLRAADRVQFMYGHETSAKSLTQVTHHLLQGIHELAQRASSERQPWSSFDESDIFLAQIKVIHTILKAVNVEESFASLIPSLLTGFSQRVLAISHDVSALEKHLRYAMQLIAIFPEDDDKIQRELEPLLQHAPHTLHRLATSASMPVVDGIPEVLHIAMTICTAMADADHTGWRKACWQAIAPQIPMIASSVVSLSQSARPSANAIAIFESTLSLQRRIANAWPGERHCDERNMFLGYIVERISLRFQMTSHENGPFGVCVACQESMDADPKNKPMVFFTMGDSNRNECCEECAWSNLQRDGSDIVRIIDRQTGQEVSLQTCTIRGMSAERLMQFSALRGRFLLDEMYAGKPFEHCHDLSCIGGAVISHVEADRPGVTDDHRRLLLQQARKETPCCLCCMPMSASNTKEGRRAEFDLAVRRLVVGLLGGSRNGEQITRECPSCAHADEKDAACATVVGGCPSCKAAWNWNLGPVSGNHAFFQDGQPIQAYTLSRQAMKKSPLGIIGLLTSTGLSGASAQKHIVEALGLRIGDDVVIRDGWYVVPSDRIDRVMEKAEKCVKKLLKAHWAKEDKIKKTLHEESEA